MLRWRGWILLWVWLCLLPAWGQEGPHECALSPLEGSCPFEVENWSLELETASGQFTPFQSAFAPPRLGLTLRVKLFNSHEQGEQTRMMLVTEDGDAQVRWKGYPAAVERLVIPSPSESWRRKKLRITVFSLLLLGKENGELICNFREPLVFEDALTSSLTFLSLDRSRWPNLGDGKCLATLPRNARCKVADAWKSGPGNLEWKLGRSRDEVPIKLQATPPPAARELFLWLFPGCALALVLALLLCRRCLWATSLSLVLAYLFEILFSQALGAPDLTLRYHPSGWAEVYLWNFWLTAPLCTALCTYFVWPLRQRSAQSKG